MALWTVVVSAQTVVMPVRDVRAGMKGTGLTVFAGTKIEPFDVEILGVLENAGPKQAVILARLSGGPLQHTGVMQGMSGSPVYINGKLLGAVAMAFSLSKDPIAGIRPFEEMIDAKALNRPALRAEANPVLCQAFRHCGEPEQTAFQWGGARLREIATPVAFSGFTERTLETFAPQLRLMGLEPRQGVSGGGASRLPQGTGRNLKPGAMISVQLVSGDVAIAADGTVTQVEGNRIYAFGHRFVSLGDVELPFASSEVITLLPNLSTSFKISTARELLGTITHDYSTAVRGEIGRKARMIPVSVTVKGSGNRVSHYDFETVNDAAMTPFLLQLAVFSALDATERTIGGISYTVRQTIDFEKAAPVESANIFSGEFNIPQLAAQNVAIPVAYAMQSGFPELRVKRLKVDIDAVDRKNQLVVEEFTAGRRTVRPGETIPLTLVLASEGKRVTKQAQYKVPAGAATGPLNFTVADALVTNFNEFRQAVMVPARTPGQVIDLLKGLRGNTNAYVRVWRADTSYQSGGAEFPAPPPSIGMLMGRTQGNTLTAGVGNAKVAEIAIDGLDAMISGTKTVTVEVKE